MKKEGLCTGTAVNIMIVAGGSGELVRSKTLTATGLSVCAIWQAISKV